MTTETRPAYYMVQVRFKDFEDSLQRYGMPTFPIIAKFGGEMIAGSRKPQVVEGEWDGNWAAVLRFPSMEAAQSWFDSPEYQPYKELRRNELTEDARMMLVEGFDAASLGG